MTNTTNGKEKFVSIYQFANLVGSRPQHLYSLNREGKIPEDLIKEGLDGKPMLSLERAQEWWKNRLLAREEKKAEKVMLVQDPIATLQMLVAWFEQTKHREITKSLKEVLVKLESEQE